MGTTAPKPFVFVLMPFDKEFDDIYTSGIKLACEKAGAYAERVDEQIFTESILDRIYNQISKADVIVSDMTGRNPNVFYETSYAHALGKTVILLTKTADDIPFDLKHYQHIVYSGRIVDLVPELEKKVRWALQEPRGDALRHEIEFYIDTHRLPNEKEIPWLDWRPHELRLKIDAHNPIDRQIKEAEFKIGIVTNATNSLKMISKGLITYFKQPDGNVIAIENHKEVIEAGSWRSAYFFFEYSHDVFQDGVMFEATLRKFSQEGVTDTPFNIILCKKES